MQQLQAQQHIQDKPEIHSQKAINAATQYYNN